MNKLKYLLSTILVALCATSCVDILDDNVNPDRAHAITAQNSLPVIVFYVLAQKKIIKGVVDGAVK